MTLICVETSWKDEKSSPKYEKGIQGGFHPLKRTKCMLPNVNVIAVWKETDYSFDRHFQSLLQDFKRPIKTG